MTFKRLSICLLVLLMVFSFTFALADDYGKAVIDAPSGKLHLRKEASSDSESLGLFFTGTKVTLKSEVQDGWVYVKLGYIYGYMNAKYLKTGAAADRVKEQFWSGTVKANKYARMRGGPSTQYQFFRNVNDGEDVTILGETAENWYFVQYKGDRGFISANLIYTSGKVDRYADDREDEEPEYMPLPITTPEPAYGWRQAYRSYILNKADSRDTFALIYVNDDDIPELVIDSGVEAEGCRILTYDGRQVNVLATRRLGFTYIERGNRLNNSDGSMDSYFDDVYEIRNGRWALVARGEYYGYLSGWNDVIQRYVCRYYIWNGAQTTIDRYLIGLSAVYDSQRAVGVEEGYSLSNMLSILAGRSF